MTPLVCSHPFYQVEPQYLFNPYIKDNTRNLSILPCGAMGNVEEPSDRIEILKRLSDLPKGRIWYSMQAEAFHNDPVYIHQNQLFLEKIIQHDFSLSILTTSKLVMKYIQELQNIRQAEVGVLFHSDKNHQEISPSVAERLEILRRVYLSEVRTFAHIDLRFNSDLMNLGELIGGYVHHVTLSQAYAFEALEDVLSTYQRPIFCTELGANV